MGLATFGDAAVNVAGGGGGNALPCDLGEVEGGQADACAADKDSCVGWVGLATFGDAAVNVAGGGGGDALPCDLGEAEGRRADACAAEEVFTKYHPLAQRM